MGARNVPTAFSTALAGSHVNLFPLLEIGWTSGTQYLCGLDFAVTWSGNTYSPALGLIGIEPITETGSSWEGLQITLAGVSSTSIALGLAEPMQGRPITLRLAALDGSNNLQVDANCWSGQLDAPVLSDGPQGATLVLRAEHRMANWDRPRTRRYTDAQLQKDYPGDLGLQYVAEMENKRIVWPSAAFFKQ
jgi:hypothetical protein